MSAYWRELGAGSRPCLAFHCSLAHSGAWKAVAHQLRNDLSIRAMDTPAHGNSSGLATDPRQVETAVAWAESGLTEPVDLIGHSFGGYIALRLALKRPELVKSVWVYEPVFFAAVRDSEPELYAENVARLATVQAALDAGDAETAARLFMQDWGNGEHWDDITEDAKTYFRDRVAHACAVNPTLSEDPEGVLQELPSLKMPVRFVDGSASPKIVPLIQDQLAALIPNATRFTLQGAAHMGPINNPRRSAADISAFLGLP